MKPKLDNYVFREWVDAAIACQDDKSLKSTLTPIIGKLSDMRIVAAELDYLLYEPFGRCPLLPDSGLCDL